MADLTHELITTGFTFDGYRIVKYLGLVRGITVRSRSIVGTLGGALQTLAGGNISMFTELCEESRQEAYDLMVEHAAKMGANGIVAIEYSIVRDFTAKPSFPRAPLFHTRAPR